MAKYRDYGIDFPFRRGDNGYYFDTTKSEKDAIKASLRHLLLTKKGERLMKPEFGTNLLDFVFEQDDKETENSILYEIQDTVKKFLPSITITKININKVEEQSINIEVNYSFTNGGFVTKDTLNITI